MKEHNHMLWMLLACTAPLLVILLLPVFGIQSEYNTFIFVIVMFIAHIWMMKGHGQNRNSSGKKGDEKHEH